MGNVPLNQCMTAIFNFNAGNVVENPVVAHVDIVTHAHVNGGVFNAAEHVIFDEPIFTKLGKNAVYAGIHYPVIADRKVIPRLPHDGIAFVVRYFEPLHGKAVT